MTRETQKGGSRGYSADEACGKRPFAGAKPAPEPIKLEPLNGTLDAIMVKKPDGSVDKEATLAAKAEAAQRILDADPGLRERHRFSYVSGRIEERLL
ncbi:MAG: hypothetical protein AB1324_01490 [Candidatus Micrarchaeota archaeon]